ncbi:hypothetical protein [Polaribacter sp. M15]
MKSIQKTAALAILLIAIFSFAKLKSKTVKSAVNLAEINVVALLSKQELGCRPSNAVLFYVDTEIIKKYRGFSEIKAEVFMVDRVSGAKKALTNGHILVPHHKDAMIKSHGEIANNKWIALKNGDKIKESANSSSYDFTKLIKYEVIYNSYIRATNKLLKINRV